MTRTTAPRHRVIIVGSGFGGLFAAKSLGRAPDTIEVVVISRTNHHLFPPLSIKSPRASSPQAKACWRSIQTTPWLWC